MKRSAQEIKQLREQLDELTGTGQLRLVSDQAAGLHPSDLADLIESLAEEYRVEILCMLPTPLASQALVEMAEGEDR
ncbi:MAG TPA: hypothetical protein EYO83_04900, partial [Gemmatimonadetes bacterium]|nr:hypothetical protein [Gemmatimonadota bacterium]